MSLFGRSLSLAPPLGSTSQQQSSNPLLSSQNPFGSTGQASQAQAGQPAGGLGFGSLLRGGSTPGQQSSAFGLGGLGASTAQPSLFGSTAATSQPSLGGLGTTATAGASTLGLSQSQAPQQPQAQPTGAYFDSLLAKSRKQADGETVSEELPSLHLGLGDLRERLKKLGPRGQRQQDRPVNGRAHYVLAASGVDPGAAVKDLGAFGLQASSGGRGERVSHGLAPGEVDVDTYLANIQSKTTLSMIADGLERSARDFDRFLEDNVTMEWEAQRRRIYQHFGIKPRDDSAPDAPSGVGREGQGGFGRSRRSRSHQGTPGAKSADKTSVLGKSAFQRSVIGTPSRIGAHAPEFSDVDALGDNGAANGVPSMDDRFLREKQTKLADKIRGLNDARQSDQPIYLLHELAEVEAKSGDPHGPHIVEAYRALMEVVEEKPEEDSVAKERQFAKWYLDPNPNSPNTTNMRKRILAGANRFLERQFFDEVESLIAKYPQDASQGGRPDVVSKIRAYIRLRIHRKELVPDNTGELQEVAGEYVWAVVFYLLRSGHVKEAAQYVNDNQNHFRSIDRTFSGYINTYASSEDRRLKRAMQDRCNNEYHQRARVAPENSIDPFRMACYKVIGRCEVNNRSLDGLMTDVNDWIWLQFNLAREGDRAAELASETYGLAELQASIREIGLKHFPKTTSDDATGSSFGMFFYLQVLAGMFEQAIAYLYPFSYVDAVHFAVALEYYGLLRASDAASADNVLLTHTTRDLPQINFGRMLGYYTRDFRSADAAAAVDYLALICLNADDLTQEPDKAHAALCHEALRELVLETREFSKLIGDVWPDGRRIRGYIERRGSLIALREEDDFVRTITLQAASFADDNGRTTDAVLLYHLAGDYDTVVAIVSRALSEAVSVDIGEDPVRLVPIKPRVEGAGGTTAAGAAETQRPGSSLSLAAIDDPVELARTMMTMYEKDQMFRQKIRDVNRVACSVLLQMSEIKTLVAAGQWMQCFDKIRSLEILPLDAHGDPSAIRSYAARFSSLPQPVAVNVPNLLSWTLLCCTRQRERLLAGQFTANESTSRVLADELRQASVDLVTYTSQLRYRFPPSLLEALARASAD